MDIKKIKGDSKQSKVGGTSLPNSGPIEDSISHGDQLSVEIEASELWLSVSINIETPCNALDSALCIKVSKEMTTNKLLLIL